VNADDLGVRSGLQAEFHQALNTFTVGTERNLGAAGIVIAPVGISGERSLPDRPQIDMPILDRFVIALKQDRAGLALGELELPVYVSGTG